MASANASIATNEKIVDLTDYRKQKQQEQQCKFEIDNIYQCKMVPGLYIHIIGMQSVEADFTRPDVYIGETNVGDLAILMEGDEFNWEVTDYNSWENSIPEELKVPEE